jgi:CO/xanthine dehydrogenase Mo-binding subunit
VKLGARRDGSMTAIELHCLTDLGAYGAWLPDMPAPALLMYRCANARAENRGVFTNTGTFEAFRAPGFVEGTFAIESAIDNARLQLIDIAAQLFEVAPDTLEVRGGAIYSGEARLSSVRELAQKLGDAMISGSGSRGPDPEGVRIVTSGAQFVEVEVDTFTGRVRVVRVVAAHDCGRIVNPLTFRSQIECGIIQGLGYALTERRMIDSTAGLALNANLADYKLPTSADVPPIEVLRIDIPDLAANPTGAKGAGEPPIIPTAEAIANAVADAIGVRIRELPITPEKVLDALRGASSAQ